MLRTEAVRTGLFDLRDRASIGLKRMSLLLPMLLGSMSALAQDGSGHVFVETNEGGVPGRNAILAYRRDARGLLTEVRGSPFSARGTGTHPTSDLSLSTLGPLDSDQCMILDERRSRLFAVNSGSDTIAVFNVGSNGRLAHVPGSPFPSGGINPSSVGLSRAGVLVVANKDYDLGRPGFNPATRQGSYTSFRVNGRGQLVQVPNSTLPAGPVGGVGPMHAVPSQALISRDGRTFYDANFFGLQVRSFNILPDGRILPAAAMMLPPPAGTSKLKLPVPLGLQVHPTQPILYVGFVLDKAFGVYVLGENGVMVFVKAVSISGSGPCWLLTNDAGTRLYTCNNFDNTVSVFDITSPFDPVLLQQVRLPQGLNAASPFQLAFDRQNRFLHVVTQAATSKQDPELANGVVVLSVDGNGMLRVVDFVPIPSSNGSRPQGIAAR